MKYHKMLYIKSQNFCTLCKKLAVTSECVVKSESSTGEEKEENYFSGYKLRSDSDFVLMRKNRDTFL